MAEHFVLTAEQLSKIQDLSSRLSRDPAFLAAVGKAYQSVVPSAADGKPTDTHDLTSRLSRDPAFLTAVEKAFKGVLPSKPGAKPELPDMASFGWSIPVADDDGHSSAAVMAAIAVAAVAALAEKS
jgi:hypothetical protein